MIKENIDKIKTANESDYKLLLIAAHQYTENKNSENPNETIEKSMIAVVTEILDKYGIKYQNDLLGDYK